MVFSPFKPLHFIQPVQVWRKNIRLVTSHENLSFFEVSARLGANMGAVSPGWELTWEQSMNPCCFKELA